MQMSWELHSPFSELSQKQGSVLLYQRVILCSFRAGQGILTSWSLQGILEPLSQTLSFRWSYHKALSVAADMLRMKAEDIRVLEQERAHIPRRLYRETAVCSESVYPPPGCYSAVPVLPGGQKQGRSDSA